MALTTDLVAYWVLSESSGTRVDSHGSNDLTDFTSGGTGNATGKIGNGAAFTGQAGSLALNNSSDLDLGADTAFAFYLWVKFSNLSTYRIIVGRNNPDIPLNNNHMMYRLMYDGPSGKLAFTIANGASNQTVYSDNYGVVTTGVWYFIVVWHDPSADTINLHVGDDGGSMSSPDSAAWSGGTQAAPVDGYFRLGDQPTGGFELVGTLDEVAFRKGSFWDATERSQLYNGGNGLAYPLSVGGPGSGKRRVALVG